MNKTYIQPEIITHEFDGEDIVTSPSSNPNPGGSEGGDTPLMSTNYNSYSM